MPLFLYGDDDYRSGQKLKEIKEDFKLKVDPSGVNITTFDGADFDLEKFNNASAQQGFLAAKRLVIVKNLLAAKLDKDRSEKLAEIIKSLNDSDNSYVFWESGSPDKRTALFRLLAKDKKMVMEFKPLEYGPLVDWLKNRRGALHVPSTVEFTGLRGFFAQVRWSALFGRRAMRFRT